MCLSQCLSQPGPRLGGSVRVSARETQSALAQSAQQEAEARDPVPGADLAPGDLAVGDRQMEVSLQAGPMLGVQAHARVVKAIAAPALLLGPIHGHVGILDQPFRDGDENVGQLITNAIATIGENIRVRRFVRYALGEEL